MVSHGRFGVPLLGERVAPRCTRADGLLVVTLRRGRIESQRRIEMSVSSGEDLLAALKDCSVETLVCGGLSRDLRELLLAQGIQAIDNVACTQGELSQALELGTLHPGYGFGSARCDAREAQSVEAAKVLAGFDGIDCLGCEDRGCVAGADCPAEPFDLPSDLPPVTRSMLDATADVALEDRNLCRLAEIVYFSLGMQYGKLGIAYCSELSESARILGAVLGRFFEVVAVCCKVNGRERHASGPGDDRSRRRTCNPLSQARQLERAGTDLNVIAGLCVGADCLFTQASNAPVVTLFTKDRMLANNAFAALYSERYLHESLTGMPARRDGVSSFTDREATVTGRKVAAAEGEIAGAALKER